MNSDSWNDTVTTKSLFNIDTTAYIKWEVLVPEGDIPDVLVSMVTTLLPLALREKSHNCYG
jgi:hypothetical protein